MRLTVVAKQKQGERCRKIVSGAIYVSDLYFNFNDVVVLKVYGEKDGDGFYFGESRFGQKGYVPSNMVAPLQVSHGKKKDDPCSGGHRIHVYITI